LYLPAAGRDFGLKENDFNLKSEISPSQRLSEPEAKI
jgi:hypothetical protein